MVSLHALPGAQAEEPPGPVVVELRSQATPAGRTVTLGDVARLHGGSELLRERIARLDVAELPPSGASSALRRAAVEFRLRLADVPPALYRLTGADEVVLAPARRAVPEDRIVAAARAALLRRLPVPAEDVSIRQVQPVAAQVPVAADPDEVRITAEPHTAGPLTGRVQMDVTVTVGGERRRSVPVYLDVRPLTAVAVCRQRVERDEAFTESNVSVERRAVEPGQRPAAPDAVLGRRARRPIPPGQVVAAADVEDAPAGGPVVVRLRQVVKLVVSLGPVNVVADGEAQQEGRVGQLIRAVNLESKKVVAGRVRGPGLIEVEPAGN